MKTQSTLPSLTAAAILTVAAGCLLPSARAALSITNGDFSAAPAVDNSTDVTGWYDYDGGQFYEQAWLESGDTPFGPALALAGGGNTGKPWAYQAIGTADGATSMTVSFDYGSFADASTARDLGLTFSIYTIGSTFVPAQNVDLNGASGVTLLSTASVSAIGVAPGANAGPATVTLDLTGAGSSQLYLRITNFTPTNTNNDSGYVWVDNLSVTAVPEPAAAALLGLGGLALLGRRRN